MINDDLISKLLLNILVILKRKKIFIFTYSYNN